MPNVGDSPRAVLHIGMHKTASTALQILFAQERHELRQRGVWYPQDPHSDARAARGDVISGNLNGLRGFMASGGDWSEGVPKPLRNFLSRVDESPEEVTLFSSENLWGMNVDVDPLSVIARELRSQGVQLQVALFVRDITGFALSLYSQQVKRASHQGTFHSFVRAMASNANKNLHPRNVKQKLEYIVDVIGAENVFVMHYDSSQYDPAGVFLERVAGLQDTSWLPRNEGRVNRMFTRRELALMRYVNEKSEDGATATALSDILVRLPEFGSTRKEIRKSDVDVLSDAYGEQVAWVNDIFFPESRLWRVESDGVDTVDEMKEDAPLVPETKAALDWLVAAGPRLK